MPETNNNIFLTTENLAFSMPLIIVCSTYVYFKYVPLKYAIPILGAVAVLFQIRFMVRKQRDKKLESLDEKTIRDLIGNEDDEDNKENGAAAVKKAKNRVQARLAQERKAANRKASSKNKSSGEGEEEEDLSSFVKGSRKSKGK